MRVQIARLVSNIFDPMVLVPLGMFLIWGYFEFSWHILMVLGVAIGPVAGYVLGRGWVKRGDDWDIHRRQERIPMLLVLLGSILVAMVLAYVWGSIAFVEVLMVAWTLVCVFAGITVFWKVSIHAGVIGTYGAVALVYGWWGLALVVYGIGLLVSWARVIDRQHTWAQALVGLGLPLVVGLYLVR